MNVLFYFRNKKTTSFIVTIDNKKKTKEKIVYHCANKAALL